MKNNETVENPNQVWKWSDAAKVVSRLTLYMALVGAWCALPRLFMGEPRPVDKTPEFRNLEMVHAYTSGREGVTFYAHDEGRQVSFYDHGFDGDLDELMIQSGFNKYSTHDPGELEKWASAFEQARERATGEEFRPKFKD